MELIFLLSGVLLGGIVAWLAARASTTAQLSRLKTEKTMLTDKQNAANKEIQQYQQQLEQARQRFTQLSSAVAQHESTNTFLQQKNDTLDKQSNEKQQIIDKKTAENNTLNEQLILLKSQYTHLEQRLAQQQSETEQLQKRFSADFENLANRILEEKTQRFTETNRQNISNILNPLREKISEFEKKVTDTYDREAKERFSLNDRIKELIELNNRLGTEASNLTNALKGQAKTQGNWGEMILESILEKSGLVRDREYVVQQSYTTDDGKRLQPDVVVQYPGGRNVVIDSKVSLVAYERFANAETKEQQELALIEHINSIRKHVNDLSQKSYHTLYQIKSPDYVFMFVPVEPAFLLAIQRDTELWNYAYAKQVVLISPTNLIAVLRIIADMWRVELQNKNALEIAKKSGEMYDKFVNFVEDLQKVGKQIDDTKKTYTEAMNKLSDGRDNLIRKAEKIKELGAKSSKSLPPSLLDHENL